MRAIITGATGMIGIALTNELLEQGYDCIAIVRNHSSKIGLLPNHPRLEIIECDINHLNQLEINKPCDFLVHLAWQATTGQDRDNSYLQLDNIKYALDAVNLAKRTGCKKFVGVGSQAEYGQKSEALAANTSVDPQSGYGVAKYATSKLTKIYANQLEINHCWGRILSVYGQNDNPNSLISYLIKTFSEEEEADLTKCEQMWDYLYVKDCALALRLIAEKGINNKVYVIGSGKVQALSNYVNTIKETLNSKSNVCFGARDYYKNQPMYLCANISELTQDTGFIPKYSFEQGIKETIDYYLEQRK